MSSVSSASSVILLHLSPSSFFLSDLSRPQQSPQAAVVVEYGRVVRFTFLPGRQDRRTSPGQKRKPVDPGVVQERRVDCVRLFILGHDRLAQKERARRKVFFLRALGLSSYS